MKCEIKYMRYAQTKIIKGTSMKDFLLCFILACLSAFVVIFLLSTKMLYIIEFILITLIVLYRYKEAKKYCNSKK